MRTGPISRVLSAR